MILADLEAIKSRCEAATPGPWKTQEPGPYVHDVTATDEAGSFGIARYCSPPDARFIVGARSDLPALLEAVERLLSMLTDAQTEAEMQAAEVERLRQEVETWKGWASTQHGD